LKCKKGKNSKEDNNKKGKIILKTADNALREAYVINERTF